ncbi:MAG: FeoB-associated Cys-rich membrane protein, partial [Candidatus Methanomethylophilaceae archaeon]|nr:FeoB-associated Cys-rich membrane protein [Candidatus Methanomethylophilaceae archaeon]
MNGNLIVGGIIVIVIAVALYVVIRNKRLGKPSCGCNGCGA